jgi:two-component system response regulator AlgR
MNVFIADDEPLARERLAALLEEAGATVVGMAANGEDALREIEHLAPDVALLDIRMPVLDGLDLARALQTLARPPAVIFCTAYDEYAVRAFELHAVDYLMKPVRAERLKDALARARQLAPPALAKMAGTLAPQRQRSHICARVRGNLVLVPIGDVLYLLAEDKYVVVHHTKGQVLIEDALKSLEEEFGDRFVRIHRNCLVARERIIGLTRAPDGRIFAQITGSGDQLEVSRRNLPSLRKLARHL